jgi:hypothetical protein
MFNGSNGNMQLLLGSTLSDNSRLALVWLDDVLGTRSTVTMNFQGTYSSADLASTETFAIDATASNQQRF